MAPASHSAAFVLEVRPYRETSALVRVLTPGEGVLQLVARGVRAGAGKKGAPALEPFALLDITCSLRGTGGLGNLGKAEVERLFPRVRENLDAYAAASVWFEIVRIGVPEHHEARDIFARTEAFLAHCDEGRAFPREETVAHFAGLAAGLGYGLEPGACGECGRRGVPFTHLDPAAPALLCGACAGSGARTRLVPLPPGFAAAAAGRGPGTMPPAAARWGVYALALALESALETRLKSLPLLAGR